MIIELRCDTARPRAWIASAVRSLASAGHHVHLRWIETSTPVPRSLGWLFAIEKRALHGGCPCGADAIGRDATGASDPVATCDAVIDFTEAPTAAGSTARLYLRPLFNGLPGEQAAITAILAGDLPVIELRDEISGRIIDRGHPSTEVADGISGALDSLMVRTVTLIEANLRGAARPVSDIAPSSRRKEMGSAYMFVLCGVIRQMLRKAYHRFCYAPHWHIGWRFTDDAGVWKTHDLTGNAWQRLPERPHSFAADPFPVTWQGRTFVFFEELDHRVGKGVISAIEFNDRGPVGEISTVLEEPWHLSYPFIIEDGGELWMIPESSVAREVVLYRCKSFPGEWERHTTLLSNVELGDATIVQRDGKYYLFGVTRDGAGGYSDTLSIYHADALTGPWHAHAQNPVLLDRATARPAGHFVEQDGRLWRPVQDCSQGYGAAVALAEIVALSPTSFRQIVRHRVSHTACWPGRKLHTLNRLGHLEVIDGTRVQPKLGYLFK